MKILGLLRSVLAVFVLFGLASIGFAGVSDTTAPLPSAPICANNNITVSNGYMDLYCHETVTNLANTFPMKLNPSYTPGPSRALYLTITTSEKCANSIADVTTEPSQVSVIKDENQEGQSVVYVLSSYEAGVKVNTVRLIAKTQGFQCRNGITTFYQTTT